MISYIYNNLGSDIAYLVRSVKNSEPNSGSADCQKGLAGNRLIGLTCMGVGAYGIYKSVSILSSSIAKSSVVFSISLLVAILGKDILSISLALSKKSGLLEMRNIRTFRTEWNGLIGGLSKLSPEVLNYYTQEAFFRSFWRNLAKSS